MQPQLSYSLVNQSLTNSNNLTLLCKYEFKYEFIFSRLWVLLIPTKKIILNDMILPSELYICYTHFTQAFHSNPHFWTRFSQLKSNSCGLHFLFIHVRNPSTNSWQWVRLEVFLCKWQLHNLCLGQSIMFLIAFLIALSPSVRTDAGIFSPSTLLV